MLVAQLDYIYFFFGLVLFLLGSVCVSMSRSGPLRTPWWLLGIFAFTHGASEWVHLYALARGETAGLALLASVLVAASFILLLEFARRTSGVLRGSTPGTWVYQPLVAVVLGIAFTEGTEVLDPAVRLLLGVPAASWTAALFFSAASRTEEIGGGEDARLARLGGGAFFSAFAVFAGLIVPGAPFLPGRWPSPDTFLAATGIPIQLVRALLVGGMALSIWALAVSFDPKGRVLRKRRLLFWAMASSLALLLAGGWLFTDKLGRLHEKDVVDEAESSARLVHDHLLMEMEGADRGARTLAELLGRYHMAPSGLDDTRLDGVVDALALGAHGTVVYVLDPSGLTIASSNRDQPDSFLGKNFARRPYFQAAMQGLPGRFMGMGLVSGVPGYYGSAPVRDGSGRPVAVAVVKQALAPDQLGPPGVDSAGIVSEEGRVLVSNGPIADGVRTGGRSAWSTVDGRKTVEVSQPVPGSPWTLVVARKERTQVANRLLGIVITLLLCSVVLTYFVAMQRQLGTESRITVKRREAEGRAREAARRADTDALTGVLNRMGFNEAISREMARATRYRQPLSVVIADVDHFKRINDTFGHPVGDQVLARTARLLASCVRESDTVARWGGEEFAVIAPMTPEAGAASLAEKLRSILASTHVGPRDPVTASFGVAEMRPDDTVETLLARVDSALYQAKQSGRNQVRCAGWDGPGPGPDSTFQEGTMATADRLYTSTGFDPIDTEHEALSMALEAFVRIVNSGKVDEVRAALDGLARGVSDHFAHEEELMARFAYPDRSRHATAHASFVGEVQKWSRKVGQEEVDPGFRRWAVATLPGWFRFHILAHDMGLGQFLLRQEAAPPVDGARPPNGATSGAR